MMIQTENAENPHKVGPDAHEQESGGSGHVSDDTIYIATALEALGCEMVPGGVVLPEDYKWLQGRFTLLSELGRLCKSYGVEEMRVFASGICELKPSIDEGLNLLHKALQDKQPVPASSSLLLALAAAYNQFVATNGKVPFETLLQAMDMLLAKVRSEAEKE